MGVGIRRERKNLGTAAELLSKEAFDGGLRQNTEPWLVKFFGHLRPPRKLTWQAERSPFSIGNTFSFMVDVPLSC